MLRLHRAAVLANIPGYTEMYEYLLYAGADPTIRSNNFSPYLQPGRHLPVDLAPDVGTTKSTLHELNRMYEDKPKAGQPNPFICDWWALYDYGLEEIIQWPADYSPVFPEVRKRQIEREEKEAARERRRQFRASVLSNGAAKSDGDRVADNGKLQSSERPIAILFPGQGSQKIGMLESVKTLPKVQEMLQKCYELLGYDLLKLCQEGPQEKLDQTLYSQPALFVADLAAIEKLRRDENEIFQNIKATAGFSLGECVALVFSGALSFEDGLKLVKARAEGMSKAANKDTQAMLTIIGLDESSVKTLCRQAAKSVKGECTIANYLFPNGFTVSGSTPCIELVQEKATQAGARKVRRVAVQGAFHTGMMSSAQEYIKPFVDAIGEPQISVYSNTLAAPIESAEQARSLVVRQIVEPVQWQRIIESLVHEGYQLHEAGPGQQLLAMTRRINEDAWKCMRNTEV